MMILTRFPLLNPVLKYKRVKGMKAVWNFYNEIPEINIIAGPLHPAWDQRVEAEIKVFKIWQKFNPTIPFRNLRKDKLNRRRFYIDINLSELLEVNDIDWYTVSILIPLTYPKSWPYIGDPAREREFFRYLKEWTRNHPFCMPPILRAWWSSFKGKAGIAHFLHIFSIFLSIAGRKATRKRNYIIDI